MQSVYIAVRVRPFPRLPPLEQSGASLDPDIAGVEREGIAAFDAVPLEGLQEELRHGCIAVVRIEYINVLGPQPGTLVNILLAARSVQSRSRPDRPVWCAA